MHLKRQREKKKKERKGKEKKKKKEKEEEETKKKKKGEGQLMRDPAICLQRRPFLSPMVAWQYDDYDYDFPSW